MDINEVRSDIAAFADDDDELLIEDGGGVLFVRNGQDVTCTLEQTANSAGLRVRMSDGKTMTYDRFLTHELARLDVFAGKLIERRADLATFVDGSVSLSRPAVDTVMGGAIEILRQECENLPAFASRVTFVTADAGHGKTALLRHYQSKVAREFIAGDSPYLFWHVDLQGRQLLRLSEALMGDLGEMRHSGLWMPGIIQLLKRRKLVLAIDGFDELAAEQGGSDALGALTSLVGQLDGQGTIIAAARRTFFDAEDYLKRTSTLRRNMASATQFDRMELQPWSASDALKFLADTSYDGNTFEDAETTYLGILTALGNDDAHPMLTRPFLLSQVSKAMLAYNLEASAFVSSSSDPHKGVASVVEAFVNREVTEKWVYADTGEPYLTETQHMELLSIVAEEMHRSQKDRLSLDIIETLVVVLLEQWSVEASRQQQVMEMVKSHVLLVHPPDGDTKYRSFDHPEFREYFVAYALRTNLETCLSSGDARQLARFLSFAPLSDGSARYVAGMVDRDETNVRRAIDALTAQVQAEWRPTHLHSNVGTLVAFLLNGLTFSPSLTIDASLIYGSLVFEFSVMSGVRFVNSNFVNISLQGVSWSDVEFRNCDINEIRVDEQTTNFENVRYYESRIDSVKIMNGSDESEREYAPSRIRELLQAHGLLSASDQPELPVMATQLADNDAMKAARRFIRMFARSTSVTDQMVASRFRAGGSAALVTDVVAPALVRHEIVESRIWRGAGAQRIWALRREIEDVLAAEEDESAREHSFWVELANG